MRIKNLIIALLLISNKVFATHQIPDYLIIGKDTLQIYSNPLELYFKNKKRPKIFNDSCSLTSCWRGYIAYFKVQNDSLFLVDVYDCCQNDKKIELSKILTDRDVKKPIYADWFTGIIMSPSGKLLNYIHMGYNSIYEKEIDYFFKKGILKYKKKHINRIVKSDFRDLNNLKQFFEDRVNWDSVPKIDTLTRVFIRVKADKRGKIIQKNILKSDNELFNKEALRLIEEIDTMPVLIVRENMLINSWTLAVSFDPRKRKQ